MFNAVLTRIGVACYCRLVSDETGTTAVESAVIVGLVAIIILGAVGTLGGIVLGGFPGSDDGFVIP